jgi:hypothetical protein
VGPKVLPIFNGNPPGVGTKLGAIERLPFCVAHSSLSTSLPSPNYRIDLSQEAPKLGGLFLDHSTGDCYKWIKKKYDEKFPKKAWEFMVNVGMIMHAGRKEPPRKYDASGELVDSTKTLVKRETKQLQHFLFEVKRGRRGEWVG